MPDEVKPVAAPVVTPPVVAAEPAKSPSEKLHERAAALDAKRTAETAAIVTPPPVSAKVDMDPETLQKLTESSERARAATKRADEEQRKREAVEASQADVTSTREAVKLFKSGQRMAGIKLLLGVEDPDDEVQELLKEWTAKPAKDGEKKLSDDKIKALQDEAAEGKKFREAEQARVKIETDTRNSQIFSAQMRDRKTEEGTARYPLASSPENADTSVVVALKKANEKLLALGVKEVTRPLAEHLFDLAYGEIEANLAKAVPAPVVVAETPRVAVRAAVVPRAGTAPAQSKAYARTPEGAKERLLDRARAMDEARGQKWQ